MLIQVAILLAGVLGEVEDLTQLTCAECQACSGWEQRKIVYTVLNRVADERFRSSVYEEVRAPGEWASFPVKRCRDTLTSEKWSKGYRRYHRKLMTNLRWNVWRAYFTWTEADGPLFFHSRDLGVLWNRPIMDLPEDFYHVFYKG